MVIGRKLYRSGESVYLINGEPSKLKDIHALIRNTGLGKDGYSIVGQGRVAEIINAKPENRRNILRTRRVFSVLRKKRLKRREVLPARKKILTLSVRQKTVLKDRETLLKTK